MRNDQYISNHINTYQYIENNWQHWNTCNCYKSSCFAYHGGVRVRNPPLCHLRVMSGGIPLRSLSVEAGRGCSLPFSPRRSERVPPRLDHHGGGWEGVPPSPTTTVDNQHPPRRLAKGRGVTFPPCWPKEGGRGSLWECPPSSSISNLKTRTASR